VLIREEKTMDLLEMDRIIHEQKDQVEALKDHINHLHEDVDDLFQRIVRMEEELKKRLENGVG
jgi:peptidoglycan hydrolase CwlO-like protein